MASFRTLGALSLTDGQGREIGSVLAQPKRLALLAYLALAGPSALRRRDTVVALFWPELDQRHARGALRQALRFLRRSLGDDVIVKQGDEAVGLASGALRCDAVEFEQACDRGDVEAALELYGGELLDGLFIADAAPELDQWIDERRRELRRRAAEAAWTLAARRHDEGDRTSAARFARRAAAVAPMDEMEVRRLIAFLDECGDRSGALRAYEEFAQQLSRQFEAEPSADTQSLIQAVRTGARVTAVGGPRPRVTADADASVPAVPFPLPAPPERLPRTAAPAAAARRARSAWRAAATRGAAALAVAAGLAGAVGLIVVRSDRAADPVPVAVLATENGDPDTSRSYLVQGMIDRLIAELARAKGLRVIDARLPTGTGGARRTPKDLARRLHTDAVVTASVQWLGDSVRLTGRFTRVGGDRAGRVRSYAGTRADLLALPRLVAVDVVDWLGVTGTAAQRSALAAAGPNDSLALDRYVRGRYWSSKRGAGNLLRAIGLFGESLDQDPTFALAYAGIADAYVQLGYGSYLAPRDAFPKAAAAARQALALDSTLAEPHAALGFTRLYYDWDWSGADREFRAALAKSPSYATAHEWYSLYLAAMGRFDDARARARAARELEPLSVAVACTEGWVAHYAGRQREAKALLRTALRMDSAFAIGHFYLGRVFQAERQLDSAAAQFALAGPLRNWVPTIAARGYVYARQGRRGAAREELRHLDTLARREYVTSYAVALIYAALDDRNSAFAWLDRGIAERTHWLVWLRQDPRWEPIRSDPRFGELVRRVGLPESRASEVPRSPHSRSPSEQ
jgi:DNA-binding SARP family transcriptional activator/TolB-like protein/Tfp pilus assembly protein PilF